MTKPETEKLPALPEGVWVSDVPVGASLYTADQMRETYRQGWMDGSSDTIALTTPDAAPDAVAMKAHGYMQELEAASSLLVEAMRRVGGEMPTKLFDDIDSFIARRIAHARSAGEIGRAHV